MVMLSISSSNNRSGNNSNIVYTWFFLFLLSLFTGQPCTSVFKAAGPIKGLPSRVVSSVAADKVGRVPTAASWVPHEIITFRFDLLWCYNDDF